MKHILLICSRLDLPGGIERATVSAANLFVQKYKVTLLVLDEVGHSFYPVHEDVKIIHTHLHFGLTEQGNVATRKWAFIKHLRQLRDLLQQQDADIIIATEYPFSITAYLAGKSLKAKILSWEHHHFHWFQKSRFWQFLFRQVYPKLDCVVCLNETERVLHESIGCVSEVIPNYVERAQKAELESKVILSVGWLIRRKGIDLVPSIGSRIFKGFPDWKWKIIGTGAEKEALQKAITDQGLKEHIEIIEPSSFDLKARYLNASVYVMTSRFECFPMVLLEAMAHGVPCVSFNCPTGPSDIVTDGEDGVLVENENITAMADAICGLMEKTF